MLRPEASKSRLLEVKKGRSVYIPMAVMYVSVLTNMHVVLCVC